MKGKIVIIAILVVLIIGTFAYGVLDKNIVVNGEDNKEALVINGEVLMSPLPTLTPTPTPTPTPTTTPSATPSVKPTSTPTSTPSATPKASVPVNLVVDKNSVNSVNGAEQTVVVTVDSDAIIDTTIDSGTIETWYEPGFLYIYPSTAGSVTITAKKAGFTTASQTIAVTYEVVATPVPTAVVDNSQSSSSSMITPTLTRNDDLSFWFRGGMADTKDLFFDLAAQYGVDPFIVIAIADHETGYGTSTLCNDYYNFGGMRHADGSWYTFDNKLDGVETLTALISRYAKRGATSIEQIGSTYCPGDTVWIQRVTTIYNSFQK